jgi:hypothetical protein
VAQQAPTTAGHVTRGTPWPMPGSVSNVAPRDLRGQRHPVPVREERILLPVHQQGRYGDFAEPLAPSRLAVDGRGYAAEYPFGGGSYLPDTSSDGFLALAMVRQSGRTAASEMARRARLGHRPRKAGFCVPLRPRTRYGKAVHFSPVFMTCCYVRGFGHQG